MFYGAVGTVFIGSKTLLNSTFDLVDATNEEKEAIALFSFFLVSNTVFE